MNTAAPLILALPRLGIHIDRCIPTTPDPPSLNSPMRYWMPVAAGLMMLAGCGNADHERDHGANATEQRTEREAGAKGETTGEAMPVRMEVQVLSFAECPNSPEFESRIRKAVLLLEGGSGEMATGLEEREERPHQPRLVVVPIDQETLGEDDLRRGYPTPTALVNGDDLFGLPQPTSTAMGCRIYPGGLPSVEAIADRLREMMQR